MSGEWGGQSRLPPRSSIANKNSHSDIASSARAALKRLNSLIKESIAWRNERSELESKVMRLSSALIAAGKLPTVVLRPDPLTIRQREEILRLESARDRLEDEVKRLRISLAESDRAVTCNGARRLKEKLRNTRDEEAARRLELGDEIRRLKASLKESSCAGLNGLRKKLGEILNADSKMDRVIADAANNGANAVLDLVKEVEILRGRLGREEIVNLRLKSDIDKRVRLVERVDQLKEELDEKRKKLEEREIQITQIRNELIGAKIAFKVKEEEIEELKGAKNDLEELEKLENERNQREQELKQRLEAAYSAANEVQRLRDELGRERTRLIDLEVERDGLVEEIEKMGSIVSERNEQIVRILAENEELKSKCKDVEKLDKKISSTGDMGPKENGLKAQVDSLQGAKILLENELIVFKRRIDALRSQLETEKRERNDVEEASKKVEKENELLKSEAQRLVTGFVKQLEKLKTEKKELEHRIQELEADNIQLRSTSEKLKMLKDEVENFRTAEEFRKDSKSTETENDLNDELIRAKGDAQKALNDLTSLTSENKELKNEIGRLKEADKSEAINFGDYIRADRELKYHIHLQTLAVKRVLDFIRYVGDDGGVKPAMATFLEPTLTNAKVFKMDENVTTTFRMSQKLSERIFQAEVNVQKLQKLKNERNILRKEHDDLKNKVETLLSEKIICGIQSNPADTQSLRVDLDFDSRLSDTSFLKIGDEQLEGDDKIEEMNRRILALQDQIKSKQFEAGRRLIEIRETMRQERIRLMEIAEGGNVTTF